MRPEIINLSEHLSKVAYTLKECSAVIADLAEMYPLKYDEEDHAEMARVSDLLENSFFQYNVRMQVFTTNLARYGQPANNSVNDIQ